MINKYSSSISRVTEEVIKSFIPKDQYPGVIRLGTRLEVLGDFIAVQLGLYQRLQAIYFCIVEETVQ